MRVVTYALRGGPVLRRTTSSGAIVTRWGGWPVLLHELEQQAQAAAPHLAEVLAHGGERAA